MFIFDEVLGRAALKERIDELESERDRLEQRYEAECDRRADAVRARQDAEERINRLEDRIADLTGQLDRTRDDEPTLAFRRRERFRGRRLGEVLDRLVSYRTDAEGALTAMVTDSPPQAVREAFGDRASLVDRAAPCLALTDDVGLVSVALDPPIPPEPFVEWADGFTVDREWFLPTGLHAVAVVRSDLFAYGAYNDEERVHFEGFESDVHGDHSKGGFSQARFERRRDEQIDAHLDRCRDALDDHDPDRLIVVGEGTIVDEFVDRADYTARVDATGAPEAALDDAVRSFWTTGVYCI